MRINDEVMTGFMWFKLYALVVLTGGNFIFLFAGMYYGGPVIWNLIGGAACIGLWGSYKNILWRWGES